MKEVNVDNYTDIALNVSYFLFSFASVNAWGKVLAFFKRASN